MIKYIDYKGKKLPVRVSMYAMRMLEERNKVSLATEQVEITSLSGQRVLMYYALKIGHKHEGLKFDIEEESDEMDLIFDWCGVDFVKLIPEFFPAEETAEKKIIPKKELPKETKK